MGRILAAEERRAMTGCARRWVIAALFIAWLPAQAWAGTQGPKSPTTVTSTGAGSAWINPGNATTSDNLTAFSVITTSSQTLTATGFGFTIPAAAVIDGIVVEIEKDAPGNPVTDGNVFIVKAGVSTGTNHANPAPWPMMVNTYVAYGSATDLWGTTWTPANINAAGFGVALSATGSIAVANVDHIRITVYYHVCGDLTLEPGEQCDDGNTVGGDCCSATCQFESMGSPCASDGELCTSDVCDGAGNCTHPPGNAGAVCRVDAGECDVAEQCNGIDGTCPPDGFEMLGVPCGTATATDCTNPDTCDGAGSCLTNDLPDGTTCTDEPNPCTADTCLSGACQHVAGNAGTVCRADAGACDVAEVCDGTNPACPPDQFETAGEPCGSATDDDCTDPDTCNGLGACQPNHAPSGTLCTDDGQTCTDDKCNGSGACTHPPGHAGVQCRAAAGQCDVAENCTGSSASCPPDLPAPDGTSCDDSSMCTLGD